MDFIFIFLFSSHLDSELSFLYLPLYSPFRMGEFEYVKCKKTNLYIGIQHDKRKLCSIYCSWI